MKACRRIFPSYTTEYSNCAGNISIKWNIISPDDQAAIIEKLEDWASSQPEVKAESSGTTYKFVRDDPANGKRYSVDMLYQPYADGQHDEVSNEWFAQLQIFLYSSNLATDNSNVDTDSDTDTGTSDDVTSNDADIASEK